MDFAIDTLPGGSGMVEEGIHPGSGLRSVIQTGVLMNSEKCLGYSNAALTNTTGWTTLVTEAASAFRNRLPFPCTPCITYVQTNGAPANNQVLSVRIQGLDQFGTYVREEILNITPSNSPVVGTVQAPYVRKTRIWCTKVFAIVTKIEYQVSSVQAASDRLAVGVYWDWDIGGPPAPYEDYFYQSSQGIGTPYRVAPYSYVSTQQGMPQQAELLGVDLSPVGPIGYQIQEISIANPAIVKLSSGASGAYSLSAASVANPSAFTTTPNHGFPTGARFPVVISGHDAVPSVNRLWIATATGAGTFTIPKNVTAAGNPAVGIAILLLPNIPLDQIIPAYVMDSTGGTAGVNGLHYGFSADKDHFTIPFNNAALASGGSLIPMHQPIAHLQPFVATNLDAGLVGRGGFRIGQNASGRPSVANKWQIVKREGGLAATDGHVGLPVMSSELSSTSASRFPFIPEGRVEFRAYYRQLRGTIRSHSGRGSYAT